MVELSLSGDGRVSLSGDRVALNDKLIILHSYECTQRTVCKNYFYLLIHCAVNPLRIKQPINL